jgi:hypothetical protein
MLTIWGFDMSIGASNSVALNVFNPFNGSDAAVNREASGIIHDVISNGDVVKTAMELFLETADAKTNGFYHEYLALVDVDGTVGAYMAYDQDGQGITQVIEFKGFENATNLDAFNWDLIHTVSL